jgi:gliding motility-associated-like protein
MHRNRLHTVTVSPTPNVDFTADITEGCENLWVTFTDLTTPPVYQWRWNFGDYGEPNNTSPLKQPRHLYENSGRYDITLQVVSVDGCAASLTIPQMITIHPNPIAAFIYNPMVVSELDPTVWFFDQSNNAATWAWNFGENYYLGNESILANPIHHYEGGVGHYYVTLAVQTDYGCQDTVVKEVIIEPLITFYAPNSFTPNNDGRNDFFITYGVGIDESTFEIRIFDRWGQLVFFTPDMSKGWNGHMNDMEEILPEGVYSYIASFKDIKGNAHKERGTITLYR